MHKVLIVDDSLSISGVLKAHIEELGICSASICHSLAETKELLEKETDFFVSVLDLNLPDAPNGEVVDYVLGKKIPSIVLTGLLNEELREKILSRPIVDYVVKGGNHEVQDVMALIQRLRKNPDIKILVVDDSPSFRGYMAGILKINGYQVLEADDGTEAMKILDNTSNNITLVLTDYNMKNMDGLELTKKIRQKFRREELCIIAISSQNSPELSARFLKAGANDTLSKPFLIEEFNSRINNHVEMIEYVRLIKDLAIRDQLTGLYNRRYLFEEGSKLYSSAQKNNNPLSIALMDIDFFKKVNDTYGHDAGDLALKSISKVLKKNCRKHDIATRFGGEEFCLLVSSKNPAVFFEMLRRDIEAMDIPLKDGKILKITASIGYTDKLEETLESTLRTADLALYKAKEEGRNRVIYANGTELGGSQSNNLRASNRS